jgi:hypothetical protein
LRTLRKGELLQGLRALCKGLWLLGTLLCLHYSAFAQDLDSVPSSQRRDTLTVADQITDPAEHSAFINLFKQAPAAEMRNRAENFIAQFPQSAFLAQAYEIAARGSFDLGEYDRGLRRAKESLTLLPENPLLLVPVADVEAWQHLDSAAIDDAGEALRDLDAFAGPTSVRDEDWATVKQRLQSTANFAKGRALLQEALAQAAGEKRNQLLKESVACLLIAQGLNSRDLEIAYALGLAQLSSGKASDAAANFAIAQRGGGDLATKADETLHVVYHLLYPTSSIPFEDFRRQAEDRSRAAIREAPVEATEENSKRNHVQLSYFGSESCRGCHADIYREWLQTGMSKMFRPYAPQNVVGDFTNNNQFFLGDEAEYRGGKLQITRGPNQSLFARMLIRGGRHYFDIWQSDNKWHSYPVDYTIGSKFEQAYATKLPNGEIHVFPIQYNVGHISGR